MDLKVGTTKHLSYKSERWGLQGLQILRPNFMKLFTRYPYEMMGKNRNWGAGSLELPLLHHCYR